MNQSNINMLMAMYSRYMPAEDCYVIMEYAKQASDECMNTLFFMRIKKPVTTVLLSIFLGGIGVDRFYLGDIVLGVAKLMLGIIASLCLALCLFVGITGSVGALFFGICVYIANEIWCIVDIFVTYGKAKSINAKEVVRHLRRYCETDI